MVVGILGIGEVGSAICDLTKSKHKVFIKNKTKDEISGKKINILHVCIPFNSTFTSVVADNANKIKPGLIIIESTVAVGTTRKIYKRTGIPIVHSPVRGMHPNLLHGIKTFVKHIGPISKKIGRKVQKYYHDLDVETKICNTPEVTELGKLLDTTYYAWNIVFCKEVKKICDKFGLDFESVYMEFNHTYNAGYKKLGKPEVIRPILKPIPGGFGGHCLFENAEILHKQVDNNLQTIFVPILKIGKAM